MSTTNAVGCQTRCVLDVVRDYADGVLAEPHYQREFVWDMDRQRALINKVLQTGFVPINVTCYRIDNRPTTFLEDGKQRITTLTRARACPADFELTAEQVTALMNSSISVHYYVYADHDEAMRDFQDLNSQGTGLTPYELYRGEIEKTDVGKLVYTTVREGVARISSNLSGVSVAKQLDFSNAKNRKRAGQLYRGALALFNMWVGRKTDIQLFSNNIRKKSSQPEIRAFEAIKDMSLSSAQKKVASFCRYLELTAANVHELVARRGVVQAKKVWDEQAVRAIFAAAIYVSNRQDLRQDDFEAAVDWYLDHCENRSRWVSRFDVITSNGKQQDVRMSQLNLSWLQKAAEFGGPDLITKRTHVASGVIPKAGYHRSHVEPAAADSTATVPENGLSNMSRGRQAMTRDEVNILTQLPFPFMTPAATTDGP